MNIQIDNIRIDEMNNNLKFVIYGIDPINKNNIMITVDFAQLEDVKPICNLQDDYIPSDKQCFMGQNIYFLMKKEKSKCFNGPEFNRKTILFKDFCDCTPWDYECSFGFSRLSPDSNCERIFGKPGSAYKKIEGNFCRGNLTNLSSPNSRISLKILFYLLCAVVITFFLKIISDIYSQRQEEFSFVSNHIKLLL